MFHLPQVFSTIFKTFYVKQDYNINESLKIKYNMYVKGTLNKIIQLNKSEVHTYLQSDNFGFMNHFFGVFFERFKKSRKVFRKN